MTCCYSDDDVVQCPNRRLGELPMCQKHMMSTFRQALVAGALPRDVFQAICQEAVEALRVGQAVREFETRRTVSAARLDRERTAVARSILLKGPVVYYVRLTGGRIKIGWTTNLEQRMAVFRARPEDVIATEPGGRLVEAERHRQFAADRIGNSEEFRPSPALLDHIAGLAGQVA